LPEAESSGIKLGAKIAGPENAVRERFSIPLPRLDSPNLVYWHDTGHAQIKENLGFIPHLMHLESLRIGLRLPHP